MHFTYRSEAAGKWLERATRKWPDQMSYSQWDVSAGQSLAETLPEEVRGWDRVDFVVHGIAHAPKRSLENPLTECERDDFKDTLTTSCFSFLDAVNSVRGQLGDGSSIIVLSYLGSERVCHGYDLLGVAKAALESAVRYTAVELGRSGVRVNTLSPGPMRTLASFGLTNFRTSLEQRIVRSPLQKSTTPEDLQGAARFLLSEAGSGVTGQIVRVDSGYNIMGTWGTSDE